jgi:hypothetical protein
MSTGSLLQCPGVATCMEKLQVWAPSVCCSRPHPLQAWFVHLLQASHLLYCSSSHTNYDY